MVNPALLENEVERTYEIKTPADKMEHSKILWLITVIGGFGYLVYYFATLKGSLATGLNLTVRNVTTHTRTELSEQEAMERLAAYSYLARLLDRCEPSSADDDQPGE